MGWFHIALVPALDTRHQGRALSHPDLKSHLVRSALAVLDDHGLAEADSSVTLPSRRLKDAADYAPTHGQQASSEIVHNGTHYVRHVRATWKCVFPEGTCFDDHAPLEGLPEKMEECVKEKNL